LTIQWLAKIDNPLAGEVSCIAMYETDQLPKPAVFLDRDGTIVEDRGYLTRPEELHFYPDSFDALKKLQKYYKLFIITNQGGISKGLQKPDQVEKVNKAVESYLKEQGIEIEHTYCCPHQRKDQCKCIKPSGYFPLEAAVAYNLSLEKSWSIGDHYHDVALAENFGGRGIYVLTGHGAKHKADLPDECRIAGNLAEAVDYIIKHKERVPDNYVSAERAAEYLRQGGIVSIPTETVYGLAADGLNTDGVVKIFEAKKRPFFDPLILHGYSIEQLEPLVSEFPEKARLLAERFWPGPLTLVLPRSEKVPDMVTSGLETVALRIPSHPMARKVIELARTPLAAPSANLFGSISPTRAIHVDRQLGSRIDGIVDGGACSVGIESTIIGYWKGEFRLLRHGGVPLEEIEKWIGPVSLFKAEHKADIPAPGTMKRHYSPKTPMRLSEPGSLKSSGKFGRLVFGEHHYRDTEIIENLSPSGNLKEAAASLYHMMRKLDKLSLKEILADTLPDQGLGKAINDRLYRAATAEE